MKIINIDLDGIVTVSGEDDILTNQDVFNNVEKMLNQTAQSMGYDDIKSAVGYVGDLNLRYAHEGQTLKDWRSKCYTRCEELALTNTTPITQERIDALLIELEGLRVL